jgi:hypothetical protein
LFEWYVSMKRNRNNKGISFEIVSRFILIFVTELLLLRSHVYDI